MKPLVQPLAKWQRTLIFILLLVAFLVSLPAFMFYATGYRYDVFSDKPTITATGGLYISAEAPNSLIYINEAEVTNARVFRRASYIQGLRPTIHRVHVQSVGLHTWVKELIVLPHIVTEAEAFNLPLRPQIRPVTEFSSVRGENIVLTTSTSNVESVLEKASSSVPIILATTTATSSYLTNSEFSVLEILFAEQEQLEKLNVSEQNNKPFSFATTTATTSLTEIATTTKQRGNLTLYQKGEDIFVAISPFVSKPPHYFCAPSTLPEYLTSLGSTPNDTDTLVTETDLIEDDRSTVLETCRSEIKIDRQGQTIIAFDFLPENPNLILLHLNEGIYVVEIDDRSWQNAQNLYAGSELKMLVYGGSIFVKENDFLFEVLTEIPTK
ncbi:MAG TPA: hypothetical protein PKD95_03310 [Candidatus Paceibacterota bacterium]|nr:hypothetical protein [Candidatus Paceibacterota bacterium]